MEPSEERQKTNRIARKVIVYELAFVLVGTTGLLLLPEYKEWVAGGTGILFVAVTAFLIGYYRNSYPLTGPSLAPWLVVVLLSMYLSPIVIVAVQFALSGRATYALMVVAALFAAGLMFVVAPLMLGRKLGTGRSAGRLNG